MAGQATYCAAKAGMDHLSRAVALDQALLANGAKIVSLAPGVIDTDMQVQLRSGERPRLSRAAELRQAEGSGAADLEPRRRGPPRRLPGPRRLRRRAGGRRSRSLTSPRGAAAAGCATIGAAPPRTARDRRARRPACHDSRSPPSPRPRSSPPARRCRRRPADAARARRPTAAARGRTGDWVPPNDKLVVQGIPPIPAQHRPGRRALRRLPRPRLRRLASDAARDAGRAPQGRRQHGADLPPRRADGRAPSS